MTKPAPTSAQVRTGDLRVRACAVAHSALARALWRGHAEDRLLGAGNSIRDGHRLLQITVNGSSAAQPAWESLVEGMGYAIGRDLREVGGVWRPRGECRRHGLHLQSEELHPGKISEMSTARRTVRRMRGTKRTGRQRRASYLGVERQQRSAIARRSADRLADRACRTKPALQVVPTPLRVQRWCRIGAALQPFVRCGAVPPGHQGRNAHMRPCKCPL